MTKAKDKHSEKPKVKKVTEVNQYKVSTEEKSILVDAKTEKEAEATGFVLLLQHGEYSNENPPVITNVEEIE